MDDSVEVRTASDLQRRSLPAGLLENLASKQRVNGLDEDGITVTTRHRDLSGDPYDAEWILNPALYESIRYARHTGMQT